MSDPQLVVFDDDGFRYRVYSTPEVDVVVIATPITNYPLFNDYEPTYLREPMRFVPLVGKRDIFRDVFADPRRWMTGRFPPPVEVELASMPLPELEPPCELPRRPSRTVARVRGRRPLRGRSGRPHAYA